METSPSAPSPWLPEDDLLLKNAVEAGASLEALAKGAVQFSRRYTLRELQERWHSLLYDPDVSALASAHMFELEISGFNPAPKLNRSENSVLGNKEVSRRRKHESIRRKYYAMRKKLRSEFFSNSDLGYFEPNPDKHMMIDGNPLGQNCILGDGIPEHLRLQEEDLDILRHAFPETMTDISVASSANNGSKIGCPSSFEDNKRTGIMEGYGFDKNVASALTEGGSDILDVNIKSSKSPVTLRKSSINDDNLHNSSLGFEGRQQCTAPNSDDFSSLGVIFASGSPHLHHWGTMQDFPAPSIPVSMSLQDTDHFAGDIIPNDVESKETSSGLCTSEFADPDSLLNLSNEDEILLGDVNEKNGDSKVCADNIDSVIQVCDKVVQENVIAKVEFETEIVSEASTARAHKENPSEASSVTDHRENSVVVDVAAPSILGDHQMNLQPVADFPLRSTSKSDFTELSDGKICCVLNSEDTEIPCNDDIFLLIHPSTSFGSFAHPTSSPSMNASSSALTKNSEQAVNWPTKATDSTKASGWPQKVGIHRLPEFNSVQPFVGRAAKTESLDSRSQVLHGVVDKTIGDSSQNRSLYAISKVSNDRFPEKEVARVDIKVGDNPATTTAITGTRETGYGRPPISQPAQDSSASDHEESEIDNDVPFFSDIEAMILDGDLDPYDHDSHITRKVPSYQFDETKRTIIRLEQGARSSLQRAMTSRGALAILYGRHLRHYIRKPEVLLGRSTQDIAVDVDLRREGRANKISRRQAIIKMEADGSFFLKNLGKSSVAVNGMAVATGQLVNLSPSCLIEIKGMSFVFEINQGYVRKHLGNFCLKNKGKMGKSEWSAEDES